jgi:hypothetical protein
MKALLSLFIILSAIKTLSQQKTEALLIGTFHFNNPGQDVVKTKTFDILSKESQHELELITESIKRFKPDKIFVEWEYADQLSLDTLYNHYVNGSFEQYINSKFPKNNFYQQNEIFQLAFRAAKKSKLSKVYAVDVRNNDFPYDSLIASIDTVNQPFLRHQIDSVVEAITKIINYNNSNLSLRKNLEYLNTNSYRQMDMGFYLQYFNPAGKPNNFVGAYLVSEWYKRNFYICSLIQKQVRPDDKRILVLFGASHVTLINEFLKFDKRFKSVNPISILN